MKQRLLGFIMLFASLVSFSQIEGTWKVAPQAGAMGVGPTQGNMSWWANSIGDVTTRACFFDDTFVFNNDNSFNNVMGDETWLEGWQGVTPDQCGTPIYPHNGANPATWSYNAGAGTLTLDGTGAHLAIPKAVNGFELTDPSQAPPSITYIVFYIDDNNMTVDIEFATGWWRFILVKELSAGSDATLSDLQVDGTTVPGFSPFIQDYIYGLPAGTTDVPQITSAVPTDPDVTDIVITQASGIPGDATVEVTSANGSNTLTYTVSYQITYPLTLPVTFDDSNVNYGIGDWGGNVSSIVVDPTDPLNMVVETMDADYEWSGTFIGGPNDTGLDDPIPFVTGFTSMSMRVWSPEAGVPIIFKVENGTNTSIAAEVTVNTTMAATWETMVFDLSEQLNLAEEYHKIVLLFNAGINEPGDTYYWDDITFDGPVGIKKRYFQEITPVQNPVSEVLSFNTTEEIESAFIYSLSGQMIILEKISKNSFDVSNLSKGIYTLVAIDNNGNSLVSKIVKQ